MSWKGHFLALSQSNAFRKHSPFSHLTMAIRTIIFDLGGVLIDWNPRYVFRQIFETEEEVEKFLAEICTMEWNHLHDEGQPLAVGTENLVAQHPEWESEIRAYYGRWEEMLGGPIHESVELLAHLRTSGQYRLLALTNWSAETFPVALNRYEFLQWFEGIVVSGDEKVAKPEAEIFQRLMDRYEVKPEEAVFIDDSPKNVEGAQAVGMKAIHFRSPMQLREELAELLG